MNADSPVGWLMIFTLCSGIVVGGGSFIYFLRHRRNRLIAAHALTGDGKPDGQLAPSGALPEILALLIFAMAIMGILWAAYATRTPPRTNAIELTAPKSESSDQ